MKIRNADVEHERYTIEWAGWRRPLSVLIQRWEGFDETWFATNDYVMFAPRFYLRYWRALYRRWRDRPMARLLSGWSK